MRRDKAIKYAIIGAVALALSAYALYRFVRTEPLNYMTSSAQVRDIRQQVFASGKISGKTQVEVGAQVSGQIKKIYVATGDKVKAGDLLAEIDPEIQQNDLRRAQAQEKQIKAQIRSKKAQITLYKAENTRQQNLLKTEATSKQAAQKAAADYEMALADLDSLNAQYEQAVVSVADATTNLGYTKIVAPMDGTVYAIPVEEGQTVNANQSTPTILKMADLETMTVEAELSEADVVKVKPPMQARFTILGLPGRYFDAQLLSVDPAPASAATTNNNVATSTDTAVYYNAQLDVDNKEGLLRIDMTAEVEITVADAKQAVVVPLAAVQNEGSDGSATIYQLKDGAEVVAQSVKLGIRDDQYVQILSKDFDISTPIIIGEDVASAAGKASKARTRGPRMY